MTTQLDMIRQRTVDFIEQYKADHPKFGTDQLFSDLTGIHWNRLSLFTHGKAIPSTKELFALSKYCGASIDILFTGKVSANKATMNELKAIKKRIEQIEKTLL